MIDKNDKIKFLLIGVGINLTSTNIEACPDAEEEHSASYSKSIKIVDYSDTDLAFESPENGSCGNAGCSGGSGNGGCSGGTANGGCS